MIIYMYDCAVKISLVEFSDIYLYIEEFEEFTLLNLLHNQSKICKLRSWSRSVSNDISIMNILHFLEQLVLVFFFIHWVGFVFCILIQLFNEYLFQKTTKICLMITRNYSNTGWMKEVVRFNKLFKNADIADSHGNETLTNEYINNNENNSAPGDYDSCWPVSSSVLLQMQTMLLLVTATTW